VPTTAPARIGDQLAAIDTPALVVDLDALERNLDRMAAAVRKTGVALRPHAKAHKCPPIALAQIERGAVGVCCQKVGEAEAFVDAGVRDVLVTNEVVDPGKLARLAALARDAHIGVLVDDRAGVEAIARAAREAKATIDVLVEIDVGAHRCGVASVDDAVALAGAIDAANGLRFRGLHAYQGRAQHLRTPSERRLAIAAAVEAARGVRDAIVAAGVACATVTGAGTGTWRLECASGVYTEIQPGSYALMDADYSRNKLAAGDVAFEQSLFVVAAVMSVAVPGQVVVDAGLKAFSFDSGLPLVHGARGLEYAKASDEHGVVKLARRAHKPALGDRVWLVPGHCDPTCNLYDWLVGFRGDRVETVWPIAARGALA
jgi:D-serine deaminase-like pyridoxal phosphate-dependent protein